jgi:hypothetical protein
MHITSREKTLVQYLKDRGLVRMHFDIPLALRDHLRVAAAQDDRPMRDIYVDALVEYLRDRKIHRATDIKRNSELKLDLRGLE